MRVFCFDGRGVELFSSVRVFELFTRKNANLNYVTVSFITKIWTDIIDSGVGCILPVKIIPLDTFTPTQSS